MLLCLDCIDDQCPSYGTDNPACDEYSSLVEQLEEDEQIEKEKHFEHDSDADYWMEQCINAEAERDALRDVIAKFIKNVQGVECGEN